MQTATLDDINKAFNSGVLTSERLVQLYIKRIDAYDKKAKLRAAGAVMRDKASTTNWFGRGFGDDAPDHLVAFFPQVGGS